MASMPAMTGMPSIPGMEGMDLTCKISVSQHERLQHVR
jgi:hypothetical protein